MDSELEKQMVISCRSGDKSACTALVKAYAERVFAVCLGMLGHRQDAEDTAQQALIKALTNMGQLRDARRFGPWMGRIAKNMCTDLQRRRSIERRAEGWAGPAAQEGPREYPQLQAALARLGEEHRIALILYYFDGRSTRSIAQALMISETAAQARLSRARKKLRQLMEAERGK
ncbi:MAG: sigma-70 family RNA polymerase sigma factor [Phycisphaerales bacterium]|nr:MAG: sigma-70 family RNA polymerase sigma factor [Phycisphaerales bacterium]